MSIDARGCYSDKSQRLQAPWPKSEAKINLNWHHVIPYAMMCDCWQALAKSQELGKCHVALQSYLRIVKVENPRSILRAMAAGSLTFEEQEQLERSLAWPGWNIVEGPARRTDDPKDNRSLDAFTSGLTVSEANRQRKIKDLFLALGIFNEASAGGRVSEDAAHAVAVVMNNAERTLLAGDVIRCRPVTKLRSACTS
ncbi:MAG TPA: hypothetical protein VLY04_26405 [Bryobacteraceae bacterium]|nr:hypothetical protein [Bryobacteraceae bacterium]